MSLLSRRRFLTISAVCAALPVRAAPVPVAHWRGTALGAAASLRLEGLTDAQAAPIVAAVEAEVTRLENIFSLYRPDSELCRLNRDGYLSAPAPELLNVLSQCSALFDASDGAFDPTVQPLWLALAKHASPEAIGAAKATIGWHKVSVAVDAIRLPYPGASALTLNGIAQGAITDRIAALLGELGLRDVLIDMGEIAARGQRGDRQNWRVGLAGPEGTVLKRIALRDRAVATSESRNVMLTESQGHILNPTDFSVDHQAVSVSAPNAAIADGLSTALCLLPYRRFSPVLDQFTGAQLEMRA